MDTEEIHSESKSSNIEKKMINDDLVMTKKKLKVIKQALKDEKIKNEDIENKYKEAIVQINHLKTQIIEKDQQLQETISQKCNIEDLYLNKTKSQNEKIEVQNPRQQLKNMSKSFNQQSTFIAQSSHKIQETKRENLFVKKEGSLLQKQCNCSQEQEELINLIAQLQARLSKNQDEHQISLKQLKEQLENQKNNYEEQIQKMGIRLQQWQNNEQLQSSFVMKESVEDSFIQLDYNQQSNSNQYEQFLIKQEMQLKEQIQDLYNEKNKLVDKYYQAEEKIDKKIQEIKDVENLLSDAKEEIEMKQQMINQLNQNLLQHENEQKRMSQKLSLMMDQILEYDAYVGSNRKFGGVKINTFVNSPVTLQFVEQREHNSKVFHYFLIIDSKNVEIVINCSNIEKLFENDEGLLKVIYYIPEDGQINTQKKFQRKQDLIDCCENQLIIKTYMAIRSQLLKSFGGEEQFRKRQEKLQLNQSNVNNRNIKNQRASSSKVKKLF